MQVEAHCERNLNSANCEVLDEKHHMIAVQGIFVCIIIKASGATLKVTDLLFAFAFCKKKQTKKNRETGVLARWLFVNFDT